MKEQITIAQFLRKSYKDSLINRGLATLIQSVANSIKNISILVGQGNLINILGENKTKNIHGEMQKKLDLITNEIFLKGSKSSCLAALASEEMKNFYLVSNNYQKDDEKYLLLLDPLDGSSNIGVNSSIGTIFSILSVPSKISTECKITEEDFLQPGYKQVASGYSIYGPQSQLIFTFGNGLLVFTLNRKNNFWIMTDRNISIPQNTSEFSINISNMRHWDDATSHYIKHCLKGKDGPFGKDYNMRWVGSMVADVHRILIRGGIFLYPRDNKLANNNGKLRLMYEANPMSFLIEHAGGKAIDGNKRILSIQPKNLHQRTGVILGSKNEVDRFLESSQIT